VIQLVLY
jgi:magnesium-transporting ATPase (P-type)